MAPSFSTADTAYQNAVFRLRAACTLLERHLTPSDDEVPQPSLRPKRATEVAECAQCAAELQEQEAGSRENLVCTHRQDDEVRAADTGTEDAHARVPPIRAPRGKQPNAGVIRQEVLNLDEKFDSFTTAIAVLCSLIEDTVDRDLFEAHLVRWADYIGWMKERAAEVIALLEPTQVAPANDTPAANDTPSGSSHTNVVRNADGSGPSWLENQNLGLTHRLDGNPGQLVATDQINTGGGDKRNEDQTGDTENTGSFYEDTNLDLARRAVNVLLTTIQSDLDAVEEETGDVNTVVSESWIADMKEFCSKIEKMISVDYKEASEKLARLDKHRATGAAVGMSQNMVDYTRSLRAVQSDIRKLNSSRSSTPSTAASVETVSPWDSGRGHKAYMERLKTPSFSGKVEEWPEFRSVWTALMSDLPDSVQIQHVKASLPASDSKRVAGLKTMAEVWARLETVYGDTDLNIITVKSNLESLVPKAVLEHKRIIEVYEAVESAKTQLDNLGALNY